MNAEDIHMLRVDVSHIELENHIHFNEELLESHAFDVGFDVELDPESDMVVASYVLNVATVSSSEQEEVTASLAFVFLFAVNDLEKYTASVADESLSATPWLGASLAAMSHSTVRGLLFAIFQHTALHSFVLPSVDPAAIWAGEDLF